MKTFKERVDNLLNKTTNLEVKNVIKNIFEYTFDSNSSVTQKILLEKLSKIENLSDIEKQFIKMEEKINVLNDFYIPEVLKIIEEQKDLHRYNPQLIYAVNNIKTAFETGSQPAYFLIENLKDILYTFKGLPIIEEQLNKIKELEEKYAEDIVLIKAINILENTRYSNFYDIILNKINEYLFEKSITRNSLISEMQKYSYEPIINETIKELSKYQNNSLILVNENRDFEVSSVYSFIHINENKNLCFYSNGNYYKKINEKIIKLTKEEINRLPEDYKIINEYINSSHITINNEGLNIFLGKNKITLVLENNEKVSYVNGNKISMDIPYQYFIQSGIFEYQYYSDLEIINKIWENLNTLINWDFGKTIKNIINPNIGASIFKINEKLYLHIFNKEFNKDEFLSEINSLQLKNTLIEFLNYDISQSLYEFLDKSEAKINKIKEEQQDINNQIFELESRLLQIEELEQNKLLAPNLNELKPIVKEEINKLKKEYNKCNEKINSLSFVSEEELFEDVKLNDMVRIKGTGQTGKVVNIDEITKKLTIIDDENDTIQCDEKDIELVKDEIEASINDIENKAKKVDAEVRTNIREQYILSEDEFNYLIEEIKKSPDVNKFLCEYKNNPKQFANALYYLYEETLEKKTKNDLIGYGVKGDLRARDESEKDEPINKDKSIKFNDEDKKILGDISSKINSHIENLSNLVNSLDAYVKINQKPLSAIVNQLKSFKEAIDKELETI